MNFIKEKGFFANEYVDDGYPGTIFDRSRFQVLIEDIKTKRIIFGSGIKKYQIIPRYIVEE